MNDSTPDRAEEETAAQLDDAVPSFGYGLLPVVGLGGAAGSVDALRAFLEGTASDSGMALVAVLHLPDNGPTAFAELVEALRASTALPVVPVDRRLRLAPDTVHVLPPGRPPHMRGNFIEPAEPSGGRARHLPVDLFFRTLADSHGPHAAAVVLSGAGRRRRASASSASRSAAASPSRRTPTKRRARQHAAGAIATGMVDWVLPVARNARARMLRTSASRQQLRLPPEEPPAPTAATRAPGAGDGEAALRDVLGFLRTRTGRDFADYKRATVLRRIGRRMQVNGVGNLSGYLDCLRTRPGEAGALLQDLLISVTNFFRDARLLRRTGSAAAGAVRRQGAGRHGARLGGGLRHRRGGLLDRDAAERARAHAGERRRPIQVFATDLDEDAVRSARDGIYPPRSRPMSARSGCGRYFVQEHRGYRVRRELREMVLFARARRAARTRRSRGIDLVTCRNLLIYLNREAQAARARDPALRAAARAAAVPRRLGGGGRGTAACSRWLDKKHRIYLRSDRRRAAPAAAARARDAARALDGRRAARDRGDAAGGDLAARRAACRPPAARRRRAAVTWARNAPASCWSALAPPSILVDAEHEMVHLSPRPGVPALRRRASPAATCCARSLPTCGSSCGPRSSSAHERCERWRSRRCGARWPAASCRWPSA